jgi:hypothetical protein
VDIRHNSALNLIPANHSLQKHCELLAVSSTEEMRAFYEKMVRFACFAVSQRGFVVQLIGKKFACGVRVSRVGEAGHRFTVIPRAGFT